jgi:hypothetical protein
LLLSRPEPRLDLRNFAARRAYHLEMPQDAEAEIADLAAIINRRWGAPSGAPQAREIMIVAWDHRGVMRGRAGGFDSAPLAERRRASSSSPSRTISGFLLLAA